MCTWFMLALVKWLIKYEPILFLISLSTFHPAQGRAIRALRVLTVLSGFHQPHLGPPLPHPWLFKLSPGPSLTSWAPLVECWSPAQLCLWQGPWLAMDPGDLYPNILIDFLVWPWACLWTCLVVPKLCLMLVTLIGPHHDLWIDFPGWPWTCLIATNMSGHLD